MSTTEIREIMNRINETAMGDAVNEVDREGLEALDDIASEYGLDPNQLRAKYVDYAERQANIQKSSPEAKAKIDQDTASAKHDEIVAAKTAEIQSRVNPAHVEAVEDFLPTIQTPPGFIREEGQGYMDSSGEVYGKGSLNIMTANEGWVKLTSDDVKIVVNVSYEDEAKPAWGKTSAGIVISGHTNFNTPTGWKTFSRRGIGDSFTFDHYRREKEPLNINKIVGEQIAKATARITDYADRTEIPGLKGFTISPDQIPEITAKLQAGGSHEFRPGGFGMGYTISAKPLHPRMTGGFDPSSQGPKELADFFGVPKIFVTQQDYD